MRNVTWLALAFFLFSCGSNESSPGTETPGNEISDKDNSSGNQKKASETGAFGNWEQDAEGTRYREDHELKSMLSGYELVKYTRIDGGQYGGGSSTTKFTLCSDGSMRFYHQSSISVSVDGAGGSDGSENEDHGTWKAVETANGIKVLMMQSAKYNNTAYIEIKLTGSKIYMVRDNEWEEYFMKKIDC